MNRLIQYKTRDCGAYFEVEETRHKYEIGHRTELVAGDRTAGSIKVFTHAAIVPETPTRKVSRAEISCYIASLDAELAAT